jgi:hypothetical protein
VMKREWWQGKTGSKLKWAYMKHECFYRSVKNTV